MKIYKPKKGYEDGKYERENNVRQLRNKKMRLFVFPFYEDGAVMLVGSDRKSSRRGD
jgi:hypothetical protein